jgi:sugar lactone lactonase YvrE
MSDKTMELRIFSHEICNLGEGPLWSPERGALFWVDINRKKVFEKAFSSQDTHYDSCWQFEYTPTALARVSNTPDNLWVVTDAGLVRLELESGKQTLVVPFLLDAALRTNDAGVGPDGQLWLGIMQRKPVSAAGAVLAIDNHGKVTVHGRDIAIPNTFCWSPDGQWCYLTDSLKRTLYRLPFPAEAGEFSQYPWLDSKDAEITYDGGAVDQLGNLWVARWGGGKIEQLDTAGNTLASYATPAQRPSSCCFGGLDNNFLFITTATEGLSETDRHTTPDAGKVFMLASQYHGMKVPAYHFNSLRQ